MNTEPTESKTPVQRLVIVPTHSPTLVLRYKCESNVEHEPVTDDWLVWLEETKQWICKGCLLGVSNMSCTELDEAWDTFKTLEDLSR